MKNRSRMEILYDIISAARSPVKKTNLMYKSNLSFKQLELYLGFLVEQGLIEAKPEDEGHGRIYSATSKGYQFTKIFEDLQSYLTTSNPLRMHMPEEKMQEVDAETFATPEIEMT